MFQPEHPARGAEKRTCVSFVPRRPVKMLILTPNINFLLPLSPLEILIVAIKKLMPKQRGEENSTIDNNYVLFKGDIFLHQFVLEFFSSQKADFRY